MVVVDSSAIIPLIKIGQLSLIKKAFHKIIVPESVWEEVVVEGKKHKRQIGEFEKGKNGWYVVSSVKQHSVVDKFASENGLEKNDVIPIFVAKEQKDSLLTNDAKQYYVATSFGIEAWWLTTLILFSVKNKKIKNEEGEKILLELVSTGGMRLSSDILSELLLIIKKL